MNYVWVPFSWLPNGTFFETQEALKHYEPIWRKRNDHEGVAPGVLMGDYDICVLPSEQYVRVRVSKES